jgi:transcriptional regulator with XRE-family HTH domain
MPVFNKEAFKKIAEAAGDTEQHQIVARTGLDSGLVTRLVNGDREPHPRTLVRLAVAYEVPVDDLINRELAA